MSRKWITHSPEETRKAAAEVYNLLGESGVLLLKGDLGAGKTCFVQGLAEALGISEAVTSPTYGLVKEYGDPPRLIHADLYRLTDPEEALDLGLEEWLEQPVLCAVEWPDRIGDSIWPPGAWDLELSLVGDKENVRHLHLSRRNET